MGYGILIVDDERTLANNIRTYLERSGYDAWVADTGQAGIKAFDECKPDIVLLDLMLPDIGGLDILQRMHQTDCRVKIVMMTAHGGVKSAVDAMKSGAYDYITKPVVLSDMKRLVDRAIDAERMEETLSYYRRRDANICSIDRILGNSPPMRALKDKLAKLLQAERRLGTEPAAPLLITGATGTGKDVIARAVHFGGSRSAGPFIEINCAALPPALVEEELFGHERGSFTDAKARKFGLIEAADGGSFFLDEIGELDPGIQAKLLKVIESSKVRRVGGLREIKVNVRLIAATNRNLETLVHDGTFRSDLYYRLTTVSIEAPLLRERGNDILLLAKHFLDEYASRYKRGQLTLSDAAAQALLRHPWPGNVRELRNVIEQAVLFSSDPVITSNGLSLVPPSALHADAEQPPFALTLPTNGINLTDLEENLIVQALRKTNWNVTAAAALLGLTRDTLRYRMDKFNLSRRNAEAG